MIHTGRTQELVILRDTSAGLFLGDGQGGEVLLPNKYRPENQAIGTTVSVFVYRDSEDRQVATTLVPKILPGEFALLKVVATARMGAFLDWGLEKDLLVPHAEQMRPLEEGRWYVVRMALDEDTDRLVGSTRIERFLDNAELTVAEGEAVQLFLFSSSEAGWSAIVNGRHLGLLHANEVFKPISVGDRITGYVKTVRPDHKLDLTLQPAGYQHAIGSNTDLLAKRIQRHGGFLPYTDKSLPEDIYREFGMSKKAFKQALGALYKARMVTIGKEGITWRASAGGNEA